MHELALMQDMVEAIEERVRESGRRRVTRVVLEVGKVAGVAPDALRFCFEVCTKDGAAEGAVFDVREVPAVARCRRCGSRLECDVPYGLCGCGSAELDWVSGHELKIRELEVT